LDRSDAGKLIEKLTGVVPILVAVIVGALNAVPTLVLVNGSNAGSNVRAGNTWVGLEGSRGFDFIDSLGVSVINFSASAVFCPNVGEVLTAR
jgi:hypothetical protein